MPNLVGLFNPAAAPETLSRPLSAQLPRPRTAREPHHEYRLEAAGLAAGLLDHGLLDNGPQPVRAGPQSLLLDGELYNASELQRRHRCEASSAPQLCLELLSRHGATIARE